VVFVGNLLKEKGVLDLLEFAQSLPKKTEIWLVGRGNRNIAKGVEGVNAVGKKSHKEIGEWMRSADVFVLPSYSEGNSVALLEAMACRCPIAASGIESNREMIKDKKEGLLFEAGNNAEMSEKILMILGNKKLAERLGKNAEEKIKEKRLYWKENAERIAKVYSEAIYERNLKDGKRQ